MRTNNYVAAWHDYDSDKIIVLERDDEGNLGRVRYNAPYYFYVPDENGTYESIFGDKLIRAEFDSKRHFEAAKSHFPKRFESDIRPLARVLMDNYDGVKTPKINYAFLDIEVDYTKAIGFAGPKNPYGIINAITIYQSWTGKFITIVVPPKRRRDVPAEVLKGLILSRFEQQIAEGNLREGIIPEIRVVRSEEDLLHQMLDELENADIISGWNSEFYDIPYIAERLLLLGGERLLRKLDHLGAPPPRKEMVSKFGTEEPVYSLGGKTHLDYKALFQKFTFDGHTSYALGNILQEEVGLGKIEYEGTLEKLYNDDFELFTVYNFRDVDGLVQLDQKRKFIALANQMAHESTVLFGSVLGTVAYVETAITNHAHNKLKKIVHDKNIQEHDKVEGAIVMTPKIGLHENVGSVDINSLYPNTIRTLNISPEKIVGQFTAKEHAWRAIMAESDERLAFIFEDGSQEVLTAAEWRELLLTEKFAVSAYGTVFDQSCGNGVVADILGYWYSERKRLQAEKKKYGKLAEKETDPGKKAEYLALEEHYDLLQLTKKISMNSLYGALLNQAFRFGDERMGASVTASGRQITTFMIENIGEVLTGELIPLKKETKLDKKGKLQHLYTCDSEAIIYGDTDSCYFKCLGATNIEEAIEIADLTAQEVNSRFPGFIRNAFLCQPGYDTLIQAGREIVGSRGIFQAKKKYMIKVIDKEGKRVNELKSMGSEIKKSDTPKIIQIFLKDTVNQILDGVDYDDVATFVNNERKRIMKSGKVSLFSVGVAKQVNELDKFLAEYRAPGSQRSKSGKKLTIPGHARAALNYNFMLEQFDKGAKLIASGDKVLVYYLRPNEYNFESMAVPSDMTRFPDWFLENFKVDKSKTEERMFDSKLEGIFTAIGKDVPSPQSVLTNSLMTF